MIEIHHLRWMVLDALRHAITCARRSEEATEGTEATFLFREVAEAIARFADENPAMKNLTTASLRRMG